MVQSVRGVWLPLGDIDRILTTLFGVHFSFMDLCDTVVRLAFQPCGIDRAFVPLMC